jgi:hypothetical protein
MSTNSTKMTAAEAVIRCQVIFSHAWMVRTFIKHSDVVEDFPELMQIVRSVFDTSRALESKVSEPHEYLTTLRKKIGKLRAAAIQFSSDAPQASDHTNFRQAVISMNGCIAELEAILQMFPAPAPASMPVNFRPHGESVTVVSVSDPPSVEDIAEEEMQ